MHRKTRRAHWSMLCGLAALTLACQAEPARDTQPELDDMPADLAMVARDMVARDADIDVPNHDLGAQDQGARDQSTADAGRVDLDAGEEMGQSDAGGRLDMASADQGRADQGDPDMGAPPPVPAQLNHWLTGAASDRQAQPRGPGLILMGGGVEPDEAFRWWRGLLDGGDVVVLRVSGSDGYNDYLYREIGGVDSVETLRVDSRQLADDPYVAWQVDHAEGVFLAGGDQWQYLSLWEGTALQTALRKVHARGGVIGGTSAGLAVLGEWVFSAERGTVYSDEALDDPFDPRMRFAQDFLPLAPLRATITDSHFAQRDRMGRLLGFLARMSKAGVAAPVGIGVDERSALLIGPQTRQVVGTGSVYELRPGEAPQRCERAEALQWADVAVTRSDAQGSQSYTISASQGALVPANPY